MRIFSDVVKFKETKSSLRGRTYLIAFFLVVSFYEPVFASPTKAFLLSLCIPGGGQFYNGKYIKGTLFAAGEAGLIYGWNWANKRAEQSREDLDETRYNSSIRSRNDFIWGLVGLVFISSLDAYVDAHLQNFDVIFKEETAYLVYRVPLH